MTAILYPPLRPQSIAEVLDSAFRVFGATLPRCLPFGVLAMIAGQLPNIVALISGRSLQRFGGDDPLWWLAYVAGIVLGITFLNVILVRQEAAASARSPRRSQETAGLRLALHRATPAIVLFTLGFLIVAMCYLPLAAIPRQYWSWAVPVLTLLAGYVSLLLCCSWTALLIGGRSIVGSMRYSARLVRGNWWRSAAVYSVALSMLAVLYVCAGVIAAIVLPLTGNADLARITAVSAVMGVALGSLFVPFFCAISLVLYGDLEARREGTDLRRRMGTQQWLVAAMIVPLALLTAPAHAQGPPGLDRCLAALDAQVDIGYERIAARCPALTASLESSAWSAWLPRQWKEPGNDLSAGGLKELRDLGSRESTLAVTHPVANIQTLSPILAGLAAMQAAPSNPWARLKAWLRSRLQSARSAQGGSWLRSWIAQLGFSQAVLELMASLALAATVVLAAVLVFSEARIAGLLRKPPPLSLRRRSRGPAGAVGDPVQTLDTTPVADQPRLLLQILAAKLTRAGLLPAAGALTVRECLRAVAGLVAEDRARLADVAAAAEGVRYSAQPVAVQTLERAIFRGHELLQRLDAAQPPPYEKRVRNEGTP